VLAAFALTGPPSPAWSGSRTGCSPNDFALFTVAAAALTLSFFLFGKVGVVDKFLFNGGGNHHHLAFAGLAGLIILPTRILRGKPSFSRWRSFSSKLVDGTDMTDIGALGLSHGLQGHQVVVVIKIEQPDLAFIGGDHCHIPPRIGMSCVRSSLSSRRIFSS
jgi:hypothetical protein